MAEDFSDTEIMVATAAREMKDGDSVLVGVGVPNLACNLAKRNHAPDLRMIYESGVIDSDPSSLPLSIGDPVLASDAVKVDSMFDSFSKYLQAGRVDIGFLGGAQIDREGNINSTVIGEYDNPDVRLPGSGGACEIAIHANRTIIITPHEERRLPESVDFVTSPGYTDDHDGQGEKSLQGGPSGIITDKAVLRFDDSGHAFVESIHPGQSVADVQSKTGWDVEFADDCSTTPPPTEREIRTIRDVLDPEGVYV